MHESLVDLLRRETDYLHEAECMRRMSANFANDASDAKRGADIDARFRSLLQKSVRRGNIELVFIVSALIQSLTFREKNWFRNRAAVITFEECWPLGQPFWLTST